MYFTKFVRMAFLRTKFKILYIHIKSYIPNQTLGCGYFHYESAVYIIDCVGQRYFIIANYFLCKFNQLFSVDAHRTKSVFLSPGNATVKMTVWMGQMRTVQIHVVVRTLLVTTKPVFLEPGFVTLMMIVGTVVMSKAVVSAFV